MHAGNVVPQLVLVEYIQQQPAACGHQFWHMVMLRRVLKGNQENASKILWNNAGFTEPDMQDGLFSRKKKKRK